jgi:hypothetical protein
LRAHKITKERRVSPSEEETLEQLWITLMKKGKLSPKNIDETAYLFGVTIVAEAFLFSRAASFRTRGAQEFSASE